MKEKAIKLIKNVIRFLKFVLRVLSGVLHAIVGKCCSKKCECDKSETDE